MKSVFSKRSFIESLVQTVRAELSSVLSCSASESMMMMLEKALFVFGLHVSRKAQASLQQVRWLGLGCVLSLALTGCVTYMPVDEYNIARVAYDAAKDADAARYAPALWFSTEQAYREGQKAYEERDYGSAHRLFNSAREYAERAENAARYARHQSGDVIP